MSEKACSTAASPRMKPGISTQSSVCIASFASRVNFSGLLPERSIIVRSMPNSCFASWRAERMPCSPATECSSIRPARSITVGEVGRADIRRRQAAGGEEGRHGAIGVAAGSRAG